MEDCIFCHIIARKLSAEILYENDDAISILDIQPIHFGHALVIPKRHCRDFLALSPDAFHGVMDAVHVVSRALSRSLNLDGFNIFSNNGKIAGQSVFHFHFHITPRYQNDNIKFVLELKKYSEGEMAAYAEKIRKQIISTSV
ncbi:MAG: HIT family protein [Ignavibacteriae bacterium]|nr:HIT family protein [Ignavibacteriota bacterium]